MTLADKDRRYRDWLKTVFEPFVDGQRRHAQTLQKIGLSDAPQERGEQEDAAKDYSATLLRQLLHWRRFAKQYCDTTTAEVRTVLGQRGLAQWLGQIEALRRFLARSDRAERYGVAMRLVAPQTFASKQTATALCKLLRRGLAEELAHLTRQRMERFLVSVGIGGSAQRRFDVEPILEFARQRDLFAQSPEQIYKAFVDQKMIDADASDPAAAAAAGDESVPLLSEEQFEFLPIAGRTRASQNDLTESAFGVALSAERALTASGTRLCKSKCVLDPIRQRKVCRTEPYRYLGREYDWDYC